MELRNLKTFLYVAEQCSFSKAAILLNYSQSTVTAQIQKLEEAGCEINQLTEENRQKFTLSRCPSNLRSRPSGRSGSPASRFWKAHGFPRGTGSCGWARRAASGR